MCSHVPAAAQCVMATGKHSSGRFGGERSGKSDMWKYFNKSADGKKAECKLCLKVLVYHGKNSNLRAHLQGQHPLKYERKQENSTEKGKEKQVTLTYVYAQVSSMHGIAF